MTHAGIIHLGRTGAHIARRLLASGIPCVVFDPSPRTVAELAAERAHGARSVADLVQELDAPRAIWLTGPAADADATIVELLPHLEPGDIVVDCGGTDDAAAMRRAESLADAHVQYVDAGLCGELGRPGAACCLTLGGDEAAVRSLQPALNAIVPPGGYVHCGPVGAGHFVSMIHDGIARRLMAAYTEGFRMIQDSDHECDVTAIVAAWRRSTPVASPVMERAADEQAVAHEASVGLPEMYR